MLYIDTRGQLIQSSDERPLPSGAIRVHPDSRLPIGVAAVSAGEGSPVLVNLPNAPTGLGQVHFDPDDFEPLPALQRAQLIWGYADVIDGDGEEEDPCVA